MMQKLLRFFLNFVAIYLILDGLIHLTSIRLQSVINVWPNSAIAYATLLDTIYASFVFLVALLIFVAQNDLKKYKKLILASAIWAFMYGFLLAFLVLNKDFTEDFSTFPSLHVWFPFYNHYLLFEASLAFVYGILVIFSFKGGKNE